MHATEKSKTATRQPPHVLADATELPREQEALMFESEE